MEVKNYAKSIKKGLLIDYEIMRLKDYGIV